MWLLLRENYLLHFLDIVMTVIPLSQMENCFIVKNIKKQLTWMCSPLHIGYNKIKTSGCLLLPKA